MYVGHLAAFRHESLRTNAFDLGYVSQTLWNTGQGQLFRFTTLDGVGFRPEGLDPSTFRNPNSLLAFHIEPILIPISWLYRIYPDPRLLLWLQALLLASGAFPMALLGRQLIGGWRAGLVVGFAFLLAPGLQGAALSDFHAVAIAATWIGWMLWAIESNRPRLALVFGTLTAISREDAALLVAWLGAVLFVQRLIHRWVERRGHAGVLAAKPVPNHDGFLDRELAVPAALFLGGGMWAVACFGFIAPRFNGGGSAFWYRYAWLGENPASDLEIAAIIRGCLAIARDSGSHLLGRMRAIGFLEGFPRKGAGQDVGVSKNAGPDNRVIRSVQLEYEKLAGLKRPEICT